MLLWVQGWLDWKAWSLTVPEGYIWPLSLGAGRGGAGEAAEVLAFLVFWRWGWVPCTLFRK